MKMIGIIIERNNLTLSILFLITVIAFSWYYVDSRKKKPHEPSKIMISFDDVSLSNKKFHRKITRKLAQSFSWLKGKAKSKLLGINGKKQESDGLKSIFSTPPLSNHTLHSGVNLTNFLASNLDKYQEHAFAVLYDWGVFAGTDASILNDICSTATLVSKNKGDLFLDKNSNNLHIIKSGQCDIFFIGSDGIKQKIYELNEQNGVMASTIDAIAWITRSNFSRNSVIIECVSDCELISIPSPRNPSNGLFQSRSHTVVYAKIVRSLLLRLNTTTISTAFFQLGLAEHFLPTFPSMELPSDLISICTNLDSLHMLHTQSIKEESIALQKYALGNIFGLQSDSIDLTSLSNDELYNGYYTCPDNIMNTNAQPHAQSGASGNNPSDENTRKMQDGEEEVEGDNDAQVENIEGAGLKSKKVEYLRRRNDERALSFDSNMRPSKPMSPLFGATGDDPFNLHETYSSRAFSRDAPITVSESSYSMGSGVMLLRKSCDILSVDSNPGMYLVLKGEVKSEFIRNKTIKQDSNSKHVFGMQRVEDIPTFKAGEWFGHISLLHGTSAEWYGRRDGSTLPFLNVVATVDTWLLKLPVNVSIKILQESPSALFYFSEKGLSVMHEIIRLFDLCTKRVHLNGGDDLVKEGNYCDGVVYAVLSGRLKMIFSNPSQRAALDKEDYWAHERSEGARMTGSVAGCSLTRGSLIGDVQLLTGEPYPYTVRALRYSLLSRIPLTLLDYLSHVYPSILKCMARNISQQQHKSIGGSATKENSKSYLIVPISGSVPLDLMSQMVQYSLSKYVNNVHLVSSIHATQYCGRRLDSMTEDELIFMVGSWIQQMELEFEFVLYQADWHPSAWNRICASHCDDVLLVANALDEPENTLTEIEIENITKLIPKTLVMLHINPTPGSYPKGTRGWIEGREGVLRHVQVRLHPKNPMYDKSHFRSDFSRLARIMTNNALGLVLGGGGARGLFHLGVLEALEENGIAVDIVGGTSIGSFLGALYARDQSYIQITPVLKTWSIKMSSIWNYIYDFTFPITSYFNGFSFMRNLKLVLGEQKIEDFWLNYFCVTTDLTSHQERVHVNGTARRYIRASMSLANFLPPVCDIDSKEGTCHYLVDGGYVNIVPIDIMKLRFGARYIIAVDVSGGWAMDATHNYGHRLSGLSILLDRLNPWAQEKKVPSMAEISAQIGYVASCRQLQRTKKMADMYILAPVDKYSVLDFKFFDELRQLGLDVGREYVKQHQEELAKRTSRPQPNFHVPEKNVSSPSKHN